MKNIPLCLRIAILAVGVCCICIAHAQMPTQNVNGRITDGKDAVLAGATVAAISHALGVRHATITNADGLYVLPNLPVGGYDFNIEANGFAQQTVKDITGELESFVPHSKVSTFIFDL